MAYGQAVYPGACVGRREQQPVGPEGGVLPTALRMTKRPWEGEVVVLPFPEMQSPTVVAPRPGSQR
jgi:hypothetical protein